MISMEWLLAGLVFLGIEAAFGCLTSLWFVIGAAAAWAAREAGLPIEGQLGVFGAVSFVSILLLRPAAFLGAYAAGKLKKGRWRS